MKYRPGLAVCTQGRTAPGTQLISRFTAHRRRDALHRFEISNPLYRPATVALSDDHVYSSTLAVFPRRGRLGGE
jgi:hypothetical protein